LPKAAVKLDNFICAYLDRQDIDIKIFIR
jgi:hypothetical protein